MAKVEQQMTDGSLESLLNEKNPFGDPNPPDGFQVGDYVALIYSDHGEYIFDNPRGVITAVDTREYGVFLTVVVPALISSDRLLLLERPKPGQTITPHGE